MSDIDRIKERIRKLMAYANDGAATDGEIENAMTHAARLIDVHHLDPKEFEAAPPEDRPETIEFGMAKGRTQSSKFHRWETTLAHAVQTLFGSIKFYLDGSSEPLRVNGIVQYYSGRYAGQEKRIRRMVFYGPLLEAQEAAELYEEWVKLIASMGVIRWGGAYRGDGESYCEGFAQALYDQACKVNEQRRQYQAKALPGPAGEPTPTTTAITLYARYEALQQQAQQWLEDEAHIHLGKGHGHRGSSVGSREAFLEGRAHGTKAGFGRLEKRKQLPGG